MTPDQISAAVSCYIRMREAVIAANKIPDSGIDVALSDTRTWPASKVWQQIWWLFFYSGMKEKFATKRAIAARSGGWFDNFSEFADANSQSEHLWHVKREAAKRGHSFKAIGLSAQAFCSKSGQFTNMPYRTGAKVLHRINNLADFFVRLEAAAQFSGRSFVDELAGGDASAQNALDTAFAKLKPVTGPITAFHCLSDLGFPCHKPDIWMCRIASSCGWTPREYKADDLIKNKRDGWKVLRIACQTIADEAKSTGKVSDPNPLRALDWYVANYGMLKSPDGCPC